MDLRWAAILTKGLACHGPDDKESDLASAILPITLWGDASIQGRERKLARGHNISDPKADDGKDEKPIQVVHLGSRAKIEHTYEESQAQGSWKIVSDGSEGQEVSRLRFHLPLFPAPHHLLLLGHLVKYLKGLG